jgi:hypothetical protein
MTDFQPTVEYPAMNDRPRRRGRTVAIIVAVAVLVLGGLFLLADWLVRGIAQEVVASEIEQRLPESVDAEVGVSVGGFSVIGQYLAGRFDRVELDAPGARIQGVPVDAHVVAEGVPLDRTRAVEQASATVTIDQESLGSLVELPGGASGLRLGDGTVSYQAAVEVLGLSVGYRLTAEPVADGQNVLLVPAGVEVEAGGAALDLDGVVEQLVGSAALPVCVARYLPEGVEVTDIQITPEQARVSFESDSLVLTGAALSSTGSC